MASKKDLNYFLQTININQYDLFIFDFDGTVVEPLQVNWFGLKKELCSLMKIKYRKNSSLDKILYDIRKKSGRDGLKKAYSLVVKYESEAIRIIKIREQLDDFINKISNYKNKKITLFSTNMKNTIYKVLEKFDLLNKFNIIITKEDVLLYKPDPQGLQIIISKLKIPKIRTIYIGDSRIDLIAGRRAKINTVII